VSIEFNEENDGQGTIIRTLVIDQESKGQIYGVLRKKTRNEEYAFVYGACSAFNMDLTKPISIQFKEDEIKATQLISQ
jgi:hypothetical protein